MRHTLLIIYFAGLLACTSVKTATVDETGPPIDPTPSPINTQPPVNTKDSKPANDAPQINNDPKKTLDETLPPKVREILNKSDNFSIVVEVEERGSWEFVPDRMAVITDERLKSEILNAFYTDASAGLVPSACYNPHHGIRAEYKGRRVEIDICYSCSVIVVRSPFGEYKGGLGYENGNTRRSEEILNRITRENGVEIKK